MFMHNICYWEAYRHFLGGFCEEGFIQEGTFPEKFYTRGICQNSYIEFFLCVLLSLCQLKFTCVHVLVEIYSKRDILGKFYMEGNFHYYLKNNKNFFLFNISMLRRILGRILHNKFSRENFSRGWNCPGGIF